MLINNLHKHCFLSFHTTLANTYKWRINLNIWLDLNSVILFHKTCNFPFNLRCIQKLNLMNNWLTLKETLVRPFLIWLSLLLPLIFRPFLIQPYLIQLSLIRSFLIWPLHFQPLLIRPLLCRPLLFRPLLFRPLLFRPLLIRPLLIRPSLIRP